jgi:exonuclease III
VENPSSERDVHMRIVSWNMNHMKHSKVHQEAWDFLFNELDPDIALVQEVVLPDDVPSGYHKPLWTKPWKKKLWGSAILSRLGVLEPVWECVERGPVQVATCDIVGLGSCSIANIHSRLDSHGRVIPNLRKTFEAVLPLLQDRFIVGGDLNTARSLATAYPAEYGHGEFWNDVEEWRLHEAMPFFDAVHQHPGLERQSYWGHWLRNAAPTMGNSLQDDHVFLDANTFEQLSKCVVQDTRVVRELSDHGPIVVDIQLPA